MKWVQLDTQWISNPYRIFRTVRGWDLWVYGKQSGVIGREIQSLKLAQDMAEKHARQRPDNSDSADRSGT